jgi:3-oxoacyl-[acyl-carrier protein] reductase
MDMAKLAQKVALVTGGSRGIGAAIAKRLAEDGAAVAITYSASAERADGVVRAIRGKGGKAVAIKADAADGSAAKGAVLQTIEQLGALDIVVNNAGIIAIGEIGQFPEQEFERMLAVNVRSVFYIVREASLRMRDGGRIIFIGSVNSDSVPFPGASVYALTKGAIAGFTRGLARDLGGRGITVNNIQPGPIDTESNPASGPFAETMKGFMALKRYGHAEEVAGLVSFLAGPEGAFITGAGIKIDGGFDA